MERGVDDTWLHARADLRTQHGFPGTTGDADPVAIDDAPLLGIVWMDLEEILAMPHRVRRTPRLRADVVLAEDAAGGQDQRETRIHLFRGRHIFGEHETTLAAHEFIDMHGRRALRRLRIARPLDAAQLVDAGIADSGEGRRQPRDLVHDLGRMRVAHRITERIGQHLGDFPVGVTGHGLHDPAHPRDAPLGIGEGAILFEEGRTGQEHVGELGRLVEEQILHDDAFHRRQCGGDVAGVRIGLSDVLAFDIEALELAIQRRLEHVRQAQARLGQQGHAPIVLEGSAHAGIGDVPITRQFMRERTHVAGTLHVVLPAQGIHADPAATDVAGHHGQVGNRHDCG